MDHTRGLTASVGRSWRRRRRESFSIQNKQANTHSAKKYSGLGCNLLRPRPQRKTYRSTASDLSAVGRSIKAPLYIWTMMQNTSTSDPVQVGDVLADMLWFFNTIFFCCLRSHRATKVREVQRRSYNQTVYQSWNKLQSSCHVSTGLLRIAIANCWAHMHEVVTVVL